MSPPLAALWGFHVTADVQLVLLTSYRGYAKGATIGAGERLAQQLVDAGIAVVDSQAKLFGLGVKEHAVRSFQTRKAIEG